MDLTKAFGVDRNKEIEGIWHDIEDQDGGEPASFLLARVNNPRYRSLSFKLAQKSRRGGRRSADNQKLIRELLSKAVVKDWKNVQIRDEKTGVVRDLEFSEENCDTLLRMLPELGDDLFEKASDIEAYQDEQREEIEESF